MASYLWIPNCILFSGALGTCRSKSWSCMMNRTRVIEKTFSLNMFPPVRWPAFRTKNLYWYYWKEAGRIHLWTHCQLWPCSWESSAHQYCLTEMNEHRSVVLGCYLFGCWGGPAYFPAKLQNPRTMHQASWVTKAKRILRLYAQQTEPSLAFRRLASFIVNVHDSLLL